MRPLRPSPLALVLRPTTFAVLALVLCGSAAVAQNIGINTDGSTPAASAMLDIKATDRGLLIPRLTTAQRTGIGTPAQGLVVYDITSNSFWYYNGTAWVEVGVAANAWTPNGNGGTIPTTNFLGTIDNAGFQVRTNNLQRFEFTNTGTVHAFNNGTAAAPIYSWNTNASSGIFQQAANVLGFSTNGTERFRIPNANQIQVVPNGTAALPSYAWTTSSNTGMWLPAANNMAFSTNGNERMRITNAGWFGLRTNAPAYLFHMINGVPNVGPNTAMAVFGNAGTNGVALSGQNTSAANGYNAIEGITYGTSSGVAGLHLPTSGGGVGIYGGTNSPAAAWAGYFNGDVGATGGYYQISDERFKHDVTSLKGRDVVASIMKLRPASYMFNAKQYPGMGFDSTRTHFGFIAQELETVFPELVTTKAIPDPTTPVSAMKETNNVEGYHLVDYIGLVPILTAAIQEQQRTIEALTARITALEQNRQR